MFKKFNKRKWTIKINIIKYFVDRNTTRVAAGIFNRTNNADSSYTGIYDVRGTRDITRVTLCFLTLRNMYIEHAV